MGDKNQNQRRQNGDLLETAERRNFVIELRKAGVAYRDIARAAIKKFGAENLPSGYDCLYAAQDVSRELKKLIQANQGGIEEIRRLELERVDVALRAIWPQVQRGHLGAIDRLVKLSARRAKLCGLDAPTGIDLTSLGEKIDSLNTITVREYIRDDKSD